MVNSNNQYITFPRKYRPANFSELHGQEVLTKILSVAILNKRLAQGYLLTGIRGVGKTTSARIIAKTINCTNQVVEDINIKPCEQCNNCTSFNNRNHPDIIEIDAASRTSVDDIRKIIESSEYRPLIAQYKVFIIDEVHMLSKGAFNALLKILEEPPPHIIFIFATTEVQKIPLTVISRCQRYDLRRLTFDEILQLIKQIAEKEELKIDLEALRIIASKSDGSARDAVAMLDQATCLGSNRHEDTITAKMIDQMLGLVETETIVRFFKYIIDKNANEAIALVNHLYLSSTNLEIFIELVTDFIAYLSKAKILENYNNPIYESLSNKITELLIESSFSQLSILWQIYSKGIQEVKISHNQLIETEMLVIKSIYAQTFPPPEELVDLTNEQQYYPKHSEGSYLKTPVILSEVKNLPRHRETPQLALQDDSIVQDNNISYKITDFLKYLHLNNEIEIYYLLLNQAEIKNFTDNIIEIAGNNINPKIKEQVTKLLFTWTEKKWNVIITNQLEIISLKDQLINKVKSSKDWETLLEHFPDITILDVLLKT